MGLLQDFELYLAYAPQKAGHISQIVFSYLAAGLLRPQDMNQQAPVANCQICDLNFPSLFSHQIDGFIKTVNDYHLLHEQRL